jgi:hypothetical protein
MKSIFFYSYLLMSIVLLSTAYGQDSQGNPKTLQRPQEVEFDARVIQGQRAEGAVYLFQRAPRDLPSLLRFKKDNLSPMIEPIFGKAPVISLPAQVSSPPAILDEKADSQNQNQGANQAKEKSKRKKKSR